MTTPTTKDKRQDLFIDKFLAAKGKGTLEAATAFGKTRVALRLTQYLRRDKKDREVHIVVPHASLQSQWEGLLKEWKIEEHTTVYIINTYVKTKRKCTLLILDEIHRCAATTFSRVFEICEYTFILGLTAMLKRLDRRQTIVSRYCPIIDRITLAEARANGWVAPYQEFNLAITMTPGAMELYKIEEEKYDHALGVFQWDFGLLQRCAQSYKPTKIRVGYQGSACEKLARSYGWIGRSPEAAHQAMLRREKNFWGGDPLHPYHPERLMITAINGLRGMRKLKSIIYEYPGKIDAAVELINLFPDKKCITFAELISTADQLHERVEKSVVYHSSMTVIDETGKSLNKKKGKEYVINQVNKGSIWRIFTARALDEGSDFPEISLGIRLSGTSSATQQIQRRGRIIRKHGTKESIMINLYLKKTKEEQWLSRSQGYEGDIIWVDSITELLENIKEDETRIIETPD